MTSQDESKSLAFFFGFITLCLAIISEIFILPTGPMTIMSVMNDYRDLYFGLGVWSCGLTIVGSLICVLSFMFALYALNHVSNTFDDNTGVSAMQAHRTAKTAVIISLWSQVILIPTGIFTWLLVVDDLKIYYITIAAASGLLIILSAISSSVSSLISLYALYHFSNAIADKNNNPAVVQKAHYLAMWTGLLGILAGLVIIPTAVIGVILTIDYYSDYYYVWAVWSCILTEMSVASSVLAAALGIYALYHYSNVVDVG
jgi:hypothetical protein